MKYKHAVLLILVALALCFSFVSCTPEEQDAGVSDEPEQQEIEQKEAKESEESEPVPATSKLSSEDCLACHGSYDAIVQASSSWTSPEGDIVNPHTTVDTTIPTHENPHTSDAPPVECTKCHSEHPSDVTSADQVEKPDNINYCYNNCHHEGILRNVATATDLEEDGREQGGRSSDLSPLRMH